MQKSVLPTAQQQPESKGQHERPLDSVRVRADTAVRRVFFVVTVLPIVLFAVVLVGLVVRSLPILRAYPLEALLFGTVWKPTEQLFGFFPFILGTVWVTVFSLVLAVPACVLVSLYLVEYAHPRTRAIAKPVLDLLAAIPPVVYGLWGILAVVPFVEEFIAPFAKRYLADIPLFAVTQPTGFSILAAGIVLAVMITPLIIAVMFEVFATIPADLRNASLAVGATRLETIARVSIPHVFPGMVAAIVLGASRAFGETIAVLMVVGNVTNIPQSLFDTAYPLPALLANNYGEMMSIPMYDAALLCGGLILLVVILCFNIASTLVLRRFTR